MSLKRCIFNKCFDNSSDKLGQMIINALVADDRFPELLLDMYGNYVIQKSLQLANEATYYTIIERIKPLLHRLNGVSFGTKLLTKLTSSCKELADFKPVSKKNKKPKSNKK